MHIDMVAHRKKTADFNEGWKVRLRAQRDAGMLGFCHADARGYASHWPISG